MDVADDDDTQRTSPAWQTKTSHVLTTVAGSNPPLTCATHADLVLDPEDPTVHGISLARGRVPTLHVKDVSAAL